MLREILINGTYSWTDLGALLAKVDETYPEIENVIEKVPYSSVEHNFTDLYGDKVYTYRDVIYSFKLWHTDPAVLEQKITSFVNYMYSLGDEIDIYDTGTSYHYTGRLRSLKKVNTVGEEYGARMFECTFRCKPYRTINTVTDAFTPDPDWWPDVNNDGVANSSDAAIILTAATKIARGEDPGLTPAQLKNADANHDGRVNASDASLVLIFTALVGEGKYQNNYTDWYKFLNATIKNNPEVI